MDREQAAKRIAELSTELERHNHLYYVEVKPVISDRDFDLLMKELEALEAQWPQLASPNSPTQRVGGDITKEFATVPGLRVLGPARASERGGAVSFTLADIHPHDVAQVLDSRGIAVRAGHHCAKPAHARFGVQASTRMSSYLYTTPTEIDALIDGLNYTRNYFGLGD